MRSKLCAFDSPSLCPKPRTQYFGYPSVEVLWRASNAVATVLLMLAVDRSGNLCNHVPQGCTERRAQLRGSCLHCGSRCEVVAANNPFMPLDYMVYQLKYDGVHGRLNGTIARSEVDREEFFIVNDNHNKVFHEKDPAAIGATCSDYVCESTGMFMQKDKAELHLGGGTK